MKLSVLCVSVTNGQRKLCKKAKNQKNTQRENCTADSKYFAIIIQHAHRAITITVILLELPIVILLVSGKKRRKNLRTSEQASKRYKECQAPNAIEINTRALFCWIHDFVACQSQPCVISMSRLLFCSLPHALHPLGLAFALLHTDSEWIMLTRNWHKSTNLANWFDSSPLLLVQLKRQQHETDTYVYAIVLSKRMRIVFSAKIWIHQFQ